MSVATQQNERGSLGHRLYHGTTTFDFVGKRRYGFGLSGAIIVVSILSLFFRGLDLGIDFKGGVAWEYQSQHTTIKQAEADRIVFAQPSRRVLPAGGLLTGSKGAKLSDYTVAVSGGAKVCAKREHM